MKIEKGNGWELRLGRWQEVLTDIKANVLISDPPYSPRQASGFRSSKDYTRQAKNRSKGEKKGTITAYQGMPYSPLTQELVIDTVHAFHSVKWTVIFGDHITFRWWEYSLNRAGRYVFAPVVWLRGNCPRFAGDGPCSAVEYICVSRQRVRTYCGSLPGFYKVNPLKGEALKSRIVTGQKPLELMRALVRDYSEPGDLIVDPFAGGATTLVAAVKEGRTAIGAEMEEGIFERAVERLKGIEL